MSPVETNKALVRRYIHEAWNQGRGAVLGTVLGENFVFYDPATRQAPRRIAELQTLIDGYRIAFPDLHLTIDEQVAEGDRVVTRWTACGTHLGTLRAIPATGRQVSVTGISLHRVRQNRIVEERTNFDTLALLHLLWAPPARAGSPVAA